MYQITKTEKLAEAIYKLEVFAPEIAKNRKPGQFVIVRVDDNSERIPLTIYNADTEKGTISLIIQAIGNSTKKLCVKKEGEKLNAVAGPLGLPTHLENFGTVLCIAGGIGIAPLYPIIEGLKKAGNKIITIMGARTKELLILEDEVKNISDELIITTDDGTYGRKGLVTDAAEEVISREKINHAVIIGPVIMMKFSNMVTKKHGIPSTVSLNPIMIDGTGMCGGCRVTIGKDTKFACVDGPEFDGDLVDFDSLMKRLGMYKDHVCKLAEK